MAGAFGWGLTLLRNAVPFRSLLALCPAPSIHIHRYCHCRGLWPISCRVKIPLRSSIPRALVAGNVTAGWAPRGRTRQGGGGNLGVGEWVFIRADGSSRPVVSLVV